MKKSFYFIVSVILIFKSCSFENKQMDNIYGYALGTSYFIEYEKKEFNDKIKLRKDIDSIFNVINMSISNYEKKSIINKINTDNNNVKLDYHFIEIFLKSKEIWESTKGYFDPTIGNIVNAYGFGVKKGIKSISNFQKDSLKNITGFEKVYLNSDNKLVKKNKNIFLDFNAIGKGYTVDQIDKYFKSLGYKNYLIEIGGEIIARGKNIKTNKIWNIAIENPKLSKNRSVISSTFLNNSAIATSGNYRKNRIDSITGERYTHLIDPKRGEPIKSKILSVSVIAKDCTTADAFATALMVMPLNLGYKIINNFNELNAYWIVAEKDSIKEVFSNNWNKN